MGFDYRIPTGLGKQTLGEHKQNLVHTRTQEKGAVTPQKTEPDLPLNVQESLVEAWVNGGYCGVRGTEYNSPGISCFEGGSISLPYFASGQTTRRITVPLINRKFD